MATCSAAIRPTSDAPRVAGLALLELVVALVIGLLLVASLTIAFWSGSRSASDSGRVALALHQLMGVMVDDIRRAGYSATLPGTQHMPFSTASTAITVSGACILYAYDAPHKGGVAGRVDAVDIAGFRLMDGRLQSLSPREGLTTTDATSCREPDGWVDLTDPYEWRIEALTVSTAGSHCLRFDPASYDPEKPMTFSAWTVNPGATLRACDAGPGSPVTPAPTAWPTSNLIAIESRRIVLSLTGSPPAQPELRQTVTEAVRVRNHRTAQWKTR